MSIGKNGIFFEQYTPGTAKSGLLNGQFSDFDVGLNYGKNLKAPENLKIAYL